MGESEAVDGRVGGDEGGESQRRERGEVAQELGGAFALEDSDEDILVAVGDPVRDQEESQSPARDAGKELCVFRLPGSLFGQAGKPEWRACFCGVTLEAGREGRVLVVRHWEDD